jgi:hypothetical protein
MHSRVRAYFMQKIRALKNSPSIVTLFSNIYLFQYLYSRFYKT